MEVKPGYKLAEVGVIPDDWDVKTLGSLTTLLTNGFVGTATTAYVESDDGVLYIQGYNVQENGFNFHGIKRVSKDFHARNKKSCLQTGDLLTIQTGDIGVTTVVPPELAGANCHALIISRLRKQESEAGYYCQYFNSERGRVAFKEIETGTTMKHLNGGDMKRLFLPSPPVEEQRAIAEALSDVDGLLGGLDRLIAKKRDLKQAAMQQLLTGQTRLPGFHGEWEVTKFEKVVRHHAGNSTLIKGKLPSSEAAGLFPAFSASGQDVWCDHFEHEGDAIVVSAVGSRCGKAFAASGKWCAIANTHIVWPNTAKIDGRFLAYFINDENFWQKSGTGQPFVLFAKTFARPLGLPALPEQTAIAEVLTEMDAELAALEQRREKTRALKQAMMQELLTGRTRLLPAAAEKKTEAQR